MNNESPTPEHVWLQKRVGEWTYEMEASMGPDAPPMKATGTESVRAIGEFWTLGENRGTMPDGDPAVSILTLGFDPRTKRFTGSWIGSMMSHFWSYDGTLDAAKKVLTLEADGPAFEDQSKTAKYRDVVEFISDDHFTLSASVLGDDGAWTTFMTTHYRRKT